MPAKPTEGASSYMELSRDGANAVVQDQANFVIPFVERQYDGQPSMTAVLSVFRAIPIISDQSTLEADGQSSQGQDDDDNNNEAEPDIEVEEFTPAPPPSAEPNVEAAQPAPAPSPSAEPNVEAAQPAPAPATPPAEPDVEVTEPTFSMPPGEAWETEHHPVLLPLSAEVELVTRKLVFMSLLQGSLFSLDSLGDIVNLAAKDPSISARLNEEYDLLSGRGEQQMSLRLLEPIKRKFWITLIKPFLLNFIAYILSDSILFSPFLFPDLYYRNHSSAALQAVLYWYAYTGAYMHGFGYLDAMGIKHDIDSAHIVHLSAEIVRKLALAIKNGDSFQGRLPCVTYFGHGAVLRLVEYFIHSVAQLDGGFIGRHRPSPLQLMNLPVALLSAVMYTACRRGTLNLTASDVLDDIEAQSLILNKTEAMRFVLQNPSRFLSQIDHERLVNKFVKAYTDICSPFPKDVAADYGFVPLPDVPPEDQEPCGGAKEITYAEQVARAIDDQLCQPGGNAEIGA
ncbi:hypothetical protein BKA70DRAFT_1230878 [Coprinopsis sp. MPI-PUGE-AT-0042]|nr:hypothetical protein BKA70DRAFT_1451846 [Coprinopsis sp. MPI-PUGE-AT-0042]KAH6899601.1 hypothetical protein BKA70DRAFT_1230878 [Coprinopsis sp. MPI-PUGE-AT-0042]